VERPRIVPILSPLEELKFAQRLVCDADKRNRRIVLTTKAARVLQELKRPLGNAMYSLHVLLLHRLHCNEVHRRAAGGFDDCGASLRSRTARRTAG
jgi:DNA-binding MarR family transcriptional regulator